MLEEVEDPFMHPNQRLIPLYKWYDTRDIQLTIISCSFLFIKLDGCTGKRVAAEVNKLWAKY
jgi:hypothetical protein